MKVVVINGSPRPRGVVSQMLAHIAESLPAECEKEVFFVGDLTVKPCPGTTVTGLRRHCAGRMRWRSVRPATGAT
ncbi:NAD(P)H-dependent oxidoreductase [uncultured Alistipes sp.]|uniref:NAD(P)H-dependent oxidoreductase n=1 Tax=Alistipes sp. TaxID=1872444 RepID=UPI0034A0868B